MNNGISIREFARREGVSDTLVRRAVKQGRLRLSEDKSIDPSLGAKPSAPGANTTANRREQVFAPAAAPSDSASRANEESLEERADRLLDSGVVDMLPYGQALERKENYLALLRKLEYEEKSGALVSLELAERALFEGARAARDAWLNWPARVGPLIAADLGLEADLVTEALTQHVHKHIGQLGEPDVHFDADQ
jgi:hypothetical protein